MTLKEKELWLTEWAADLSQSIEVKYVSEMEIGFGNRCVGIMALRHYLEYDNEAPASVPDRTPKGNYLAVLIKDRTEQAIDQLYDWCKELEEVGYNLVVIKDNPKFDIHNYSAPYQILFGQDKVYLLVNPGKDLDLDIKEEEEKEVEENGSDE